MARRRMLSRRRLLQSTRAVAAAKKTRAKPVPGSERTGRLIDQLNSQTTVADIGQFRDKMTT
jgi:hypothetical protein